MCPAVDRAEYSLQQPAIVIALALGGATLATVGILRLRGWGFHPMPRQVATISLLAGLGVVGFAVVVSQIDAPPAAPAVSAAPVATLEPVGDDDPIDSNSQISGRVLSAKREPLEGVTVELVPLFEGRGVKTRADDSARDGAFSFEKVKFDLGSPYVVEAKYEGTRFSSAILRGPRGSDPKVDLVVAPPTKSLDDVDVHTESIAVVGDDAAVQVVHALTIRNRGSKAYVGKLQLPLLRGASAIQEGGGLDRRLLELAHGTMVSSKPILPGRTNITYTYVTQMSDDGIPLARTFALPTERYTVLVAGDIRVADAKGLRRDGVVELDEGPDVDNTYERSTAAGLDRGEEISARLTVDEGPDAWRIGAPLAAVAIAVALVVFGLFRRRRPPAAGDEAAPGPDAGPPPASA